MARLALFDGPIPWSSPDSVPDNKHTFHCKNHHKFTQEKVDYIKKLIQNQTPKIAIVSVNFNRIFTALKISPLQNIGFR